MKMDKVLGLGLLGAVMCMNLTSCDKEEGFGPSFMNGKLLISIEDEFSDSEGITAFEYNGNGRLSEIHDKYVCPTQNRSEIHHYKYVWYGDESITVTCTYEDEPKYSTQTNIELKDGKIASYEDKDETAKCFYDKGNRLVKIETVYKYNGEKDAFTFRWSGDNMCYISEGIGHEDYGVTLTYHKNLNGPYLFYKAIAYAGVMNSELYYLVSAHPELIGKQSKNAIASIRAMEEGREDEYVTIDYEFGKSSVIVRDTGRDKEDYWYSTMKWR